MATLTFLIALNITLTATLALAVLSKRRQARRFRDAADLLNAIRKHPTNRVPATAAVGAPTAGPLGATSPVVVDGPAQEPADAVRLAASAGFRLPGLVTDPNGRRSRLNWKDHK